MKNLPGLFLSFENWLKTPNSMIMRTGQLICVALVVIGQGVFNISPLLSASLFAAAGVPVIKHGNRSISSKCGSADLLEALGIPMETDPEKLNASLSELNFCFYLLLIFILLSNV